MSARYLSAAPVDPGMVAAAGGVTLYGPDGKPLGPSAFRSPIDYGPGTPLAPRMPGSHEARGWQFTPGWNLVPSPRGEQATGLRFQQLRLLAAAFPYARIAINHLKKKMRAKRWEIVPRESKSPNTRAAYAPEIQRVKEFFRKPNRIDGLRFGEWISQFVEEALVLDAVVFYRYPDRMGRLHSLVQIDGATIKPLIDAEGHVEGFQQILYGYPATQYSALRASTTLENLEPGELSYVVLNPKVNDVYGTPPIEEIQPLVEVGIRRMNVWRSWYTEGNLPAGFIEAPESWSDDTIRSWQAYMDDTFSGNDAARQRLRMLPFGANYKPTQQMVFTKDEDEALVSAICAFFGVPRSLFVSQALSRASSGTMSDEATDVGMRPLETAIADFLTDVIEQDLDAPDLEFAWVENPSGSELELAQARVAYVTAKILDDDEVRADLGRDPLTPEQRERMTPPPPPLLGGPDDEQPPKPGEKKPAPGASKKPAPGDDVAKAAGSDELAAWRRFAVKRLEKGKHGAAFETSALPADVAGLVRAELPLQKDAAGVRDVFSRAGELLEKAVRLTPKKKRSYEDALERVVLRKLAGDRDRLLALAGQKLHANGKEAA